MNNGEFLGKNKSLETIGEKRRILIPVNVLGKEGNRGIYPGLSDFVGNWT